VTQAPSLAERLVTALNGRFGEHPGFRAQHAKGMCTKGTFTASPGARELTRAFHMQGQPVPVTVRFSNGSGAPTRPDYANDGRGIAVKFHLPDGSVTDMVGLTLGQFFVRTPEDFIEFLGATTPDPATGQPDLGRVDAFLQRHPETRAALEAEFSQPIPASYCTCGFNGLHSFVVTNEAGDSRFIRYRWEPEAGIQTIERDVARAAGRDYLQDELKQRLAAGTAAFTLTFYLADEGDPLTDPTVAWPAERRAVEMGRLVLEEVLTDQEGGCEARIFDPTVVTDGIECSDDPILHARSQAYALSFARRRRIGHPDNVAPEGGPDADEAVAPGHVGSRVSGDHRIAVANVEGVLYAFEDTCTHRGCSLSQGTLDGTTVTCPCHGSQFDVTTGEVRRGPATRPVEVRQLDPTGAPQL
jgi:catalase